MPMLTPTAALSRYVLDRRTLSGAERRDAEVRFGFRAGGRSFLLGAGESVQIIDAVPVCPLPGTPAWCAGVINLHGILLPVFDLSKLGDATGAGRSRYIMVFGTGGRSAGIYIDALPGAIALTGAAVPAEALADGVLQSCTVRQFVMDGRVWLETQFDRLFSELSARFQHHAFARGRAGP
jgi:chemotaxis signal transduction protein